MGDDLVRQLAERFNTVVVHWHDAYAQWQVSVDGQRRTAEDCRYVGWGDTLESAVRAAIERADAGDEWPQVPEQKEVANSCGRCGGRGVLDTTLSTLSGFLADCPACHGSGRTPVSQSEDRGLAAEPRMGVLAGDS